MYCRYCGKSIADDSDFCTYCGKPLSNDTNSKNNLIKARKKLALSGFFAKHLSLIVRAACYIALGTFLLFNIKMAPFYGWWKFLAYVVEGTIAIYLTHLTKNKISENPSFVIRVFSLVFSAFIILSCVALRIVYESKVDTVEKNIPRSGSILVAVSNHTDFYSEYMSGVVYDPRTSVKINGISLFPKITLGQPANFEITVEGNHKSDSTSDAFPLYASSFTNGKYSFSKTVHIGEGIRAISATVRVTLRRYCTFWEVILY